MKRAFILLACILLLPKLVWAQYYIELNKANTFHYKNSYLIDIPLNIEPSHTNLFIQDPYKLIPFRAYHTTTLNIRDENEYLIFRNIDTMFISHNKQIGEIGLRLITLQKNITEYIVTENNNVDTLVDMDNRFKIYKPLQNVNQKNLVLIYYSESTGGEPCCYPDSVYQNAQKHGLGNFIHSFEKKHHLKIGKTYSTLLGDEGGSTMYLTLSGLNKKQKLQFLYERNNSRFSDISEKEQQKLMTVFIPYWMKINDLTSSNNQKSQALIDPNQIYIAVEVEPSYPNGLAAFQALFNNIKFSANMRCDITFVVEKDGSLDDIKILRSSDNSIDKEILRIAKKSPKWIPGKQNGIAVNVQYAVRLYKNLK